MSAWPRAHAGFGVDGAAPSLIPAGGNGSLLRLKSQDEAGQDARPRPKRLAAADVHAASFGYPRWRSWLLLAAAGPLTVNGQALCSLTKVVSNRVAWMHLAIASALVLVPAASVSVSAEADFTAVGRALWLATTFSAAAVGIVCALRAFSVGRRWRLVDRGAVEITNLATAKPGNGDAARLVDSIVVQADSIGAFVVLRVRRTNERALGLYRSRGFVPSDSGAVRGGEIAMERPPRSGAAPTRSICLADVALAASVTLSVLVAWALTTPTFLVAMSTSAALVALLAAATADRRTCRIPNRRLLLAAAFGAIACDAADVGTAFIAGATVAAAPFLLIHLIDPAALGFGDVKFAAAAGIALSAGWWPGAAVMSLIAFAIALIGRIVQSDRRRPFGPVLMTATALAVVVGAFATTTGVAA